MLAAALVRCIFNWSKDKGIRLPQEDEDDDASGVVPEIVGTALEMAVTGESEDGGDQSKVGLE
jgi:hypothetical protein